MLRIIGAALVICATGAVGMRGVSLLRRRARVLGGLISSLEMMEGEICSRLTPMREVLVKLSQDAPVEVRRLYKRAVDGMSALGRCSFYSIWRNAVAASTELRLREDEAKVLIELGLCLGRYDVKEQSEAIARVRRRLELMERRAETERDRDWKLHAFFGLASGVFAVMILL